ncbi:MAG: EAL domain-containing protein [Magnetococcales bacterium]|nr:EAL domain-containing protein [Magnetococcales bacterium]
MSDPSPPPPAADRFAVRRPLLLPLCGTLLCLLITFFLATRWLNETLETHLLRQDTQGVSRQLQQVMEEQVQFFKHQMVWMAQSDTLRRPFLAGDREALLRESRPLLEALQGSQITHLSFYRPDRVALLRVHNPELHGDLANSPTLLQAEQTGAFASGMEIGSVGTLTLRAILPWWQGSTLIGYLEMGKEIEHFTANLQAPFGRTFYTFLQREYVDALQWRDASRPFGIVLDWDSFADLVFIGPRETRYPDGLRAYLASNRWRNEDPLETLSPAMGTEHNRFFSLPMRDTQGRVVCRIVGMTEFALYQTWMRRHALLLAGVAAGLTLLLGLLFSRLLARMNQQIQVTSRALLDSSERLSSSQLLLHNTLESLGDGILVINKSRSIRYANNRFAALWDIPEEKMHGSTLSPLLAYLRERLTDPGPFLTQVLDLSATETVYHSTLHCRDGRVFEYHSFPMPCAKQPCDRVWVFHDMTRRATLEQREEHLLQSRIAISALLETGMASLSLEDQLHAALEIILAVPWLSLEDKGAIFLMEEDGEQLVMATHRGLPAELLASCAQLPVGHCLCGRAAQRREIIFADHVDENHEVCFPEMPDHGHYCVPILFRERLMGVLNLYLPAGHARKPEEESFLTTITYTLASLIERRAAEQNLLAEREFSTSLLATSPVLVVVMDPEGRAILFNQTCQRLTGYQESEVVGRSVIELLVPPAEQEALRPIWHQLVHEQTPNQQENHWQTKSGEQVLIAWSNSVIKHSDGSLRSIMATGMDITEQRRTANLLQHVAGHDALTGLPNRALFLVRLSEYLAMAARAGDEVVLMLLNLDRFKPVNDTLGHKAGDELLKEATRRILSCVRKYDLVARLGGDEFAIILPQLIHVHYMEFIARRILRELALPFHLEAGQATLSGSMGITLFPRDAQEMEVLLKNADAALYHAKNAGRNTFCFFTEEMQSVAMSRLRMEEGLRAALHNQEFVLHYQPKLDLASRQIVGMEALVRWQRPTGEGFEWVAPDAFIPLAEETGLIVPLGAWVIQAACQQNKAWQAAGLPPLRVAVNLSANQFRNPDALVETVQRALQESQLEPEFLELEITESMVMDDTAKSVQTMKIFQEMHIKLAVDDFGTGYSSLGSLKTFPIYALKIDRTFIRDPFDVQSDEAAIVQAIISLAKKLRLHVVAEGVETAEQLAFLREQGCDEIQGYYFSRPLSAEAFAAFVKQYGAGGIFT